VTGEHLLLGVTGSIAAYRTPDLAASLRREDFEIKTVLTRAAEQFVTKTSIVSMSRGQVYNSKDALTYVWHPTHIELADWADIALIAPATAATIGKLACGIAGGLLCETFLALRPEVKKYLAPAMNGHMLNQLSVQRNLNQLSDDGYTIIQPRTGELACGYEGQGKIASVKEIVTTLVINTMD